MRWYLRFRLRDADVAELLAERGLGVDAATIYAWVQEFAPRDEDAARSFRRHVGTPWSVAETDVKVAGIWTSLYRASVEHGQVVDVYTRNARATDAAATCFRRAIAATGVVPDTVTTAGAAAYPPARETVLPMVGHETGQRGQQRLARDQQHLQGRLRGRRGFKTFAGARVVCRAPAFLRNLRGRFYAFDEAAGAANSPHVSPQLRAWDVLTADHLAR